MSKTKIPPPSTPPASKTSSTPPREEAETPPEIKFDPQVAMLALQKAMELLERKDKALEPLERFHEHVDGADEEDVRIYWDVHIVHGKNKPLKRVQGSSTLPSLLSAKLLPTAPSMIQQEIVEKVAVPLTALFMLDGEKVHSPIALIEDHAPYRDVTGGVDRMSGGDRVMSLADDLDYQDDEIDDDDDDEPKARVVAEGREGERDDV